MSRTKRPARVPSVREAIRQRKPFRSVSHEAMIALALTAEAVRWPFQELLAQHGDLTPQQFNVLRILRGAGKDGLPTLEIAARMIERTPGITRLLDRMETKHLVERRRSPDDRRQVLCTISATGRKILGKLDTPVDELDDRVFAPLEKTEARTLIALLDRVRADLV